MSGFCPMCGYNLVADKPVARDGWEIDPGNREVRYGGRTLVIRRSWAVILHSVATAGSVIKAEALLARISENENVTTIAAQISQLRRFLRDRGFPSPIFGHRGLTGGYSWAGAACFVPFHSTEVSDAWPQFRSIHWRHIGRTD